MTCLPGRTLIGDHGIWKTRGGTPPCYHQRRHMLRLHNDRRRKNPVSSRKGDLAAPKVARIQRVMRMDVAKSQHRHPNRVFANVP